LQGVGSIELRSERLRGETQRDEERHRLLASPRSEERGGGGAESREQRERERERERERRGERREERD
jgi:hypothetical protein